MSEHTQTPWVLHIVKDGGNWTYQLRTVKPHNPAGGLGKHIADFNPGLLAEGNAAFTVCAVNAHDELLAAARHAETVLGAMHADGWKVGGGLLTELRAAIAKAGAL